MDFHQRIINNHPHYSYKCVLLRNCGKRIAVGFAVHSGTLVAEMIVMSKNCCWVQKEGQIVWSLLVNCNPIV